MYSEADNITQVVEQLKNGDASAFATIYNQTYKYVYSRAKCMFSDEEEVQDLVQEVYLALYRNIGSLESNESIFAWLRTTTFYQGTKMLKKKRKELLLSEENEGMFETIPDDEAEIEDDYMNRKDIEIIRDCINLLSDEQRTVLLAYYYDNLKVGEIAEILAISEGTIKSRLFLARKNLKTYIEEQEKKQGYKLHSFGPVTLALAIGAMLKQNMNVGASVSGAAFAKVCGQLNIATATETVKQAVGPGTQKVAKGIVKKIAEMGTKKLAIIAVGVIISVTVTVIGVVNHNNQDEQQFAEKEPETILQEENKEDIDAIKNSEQWQIDYAKILLKIKYMSEEATELFANENILLSSSDYGWSFWIEDTDEDKVPELFVVSRNHTTYEEKAYMFTIGSSMEECFVEQVEYVEKPTKTYFVEPRYISEVLNVNVEQKVSLLNHVAQYFRNYEDGMIMEICFSDDDASDYILKQLTELVIMYSKDEDYASVRINNQRANKATYVEGKARWIHRIGNLCRVYEDELPLYEFTKKEDASKPNGIAYLYTNYLEDNMIDRELTEEEYNEKYNEICGNEKELYSDVQYTSFDEFLRSLEISLKKGMD